MQLEQPLVDVLNSLIRINHDRVEGYEKAATAAGDADLKELFNRFALSSRKYANELTTKVIRGGGNPSTGTTLLGKIYRLWIGAKVAFEGNDRDAVLSACEYGEDTIQQAYGEALLSEAEIPGDIHALLNEQKNQLQTAHDAIKSYREAAALVHG